MAIRRTNQRRNYVIGRGFVITRQGNGILDNILNFGMKLADKDNISNVATILDSVQKIKKRFKEPLQSDSNKTGSSLTREKAKILHSIISGSGFKVIT
jgi:hypothetical protein